MRLEFDRSASPVGGGPGPPRFLASLTARRSPRLVVVGLVVAGLGLAACSSGSSTDANHRTCAQVQAANKSYGKRNYTAWQADLAQAGQISADASDPHLRHLAENAATLTNQTTTTTAPTTVAHGFHFNAGIAQAGAYVSLRDYCQANYT